MSDPMVTLDKNGVAAILTFNRPGQLNAMNGEMVDAIIAAIEKVKRLDDVRALVVQGAGGNFMAGADIKAYAQQSAEAFREFQQNASHVYAALESLPKPVIAAVCGYALGGGFEIALACDMIVAHPAARLGLPEVKLGLVPGGGGTQRLARKIGPNRAAELLMTGRQATAAELHAWGAVNVLAETTLEAACALAERVGQYPGGALADLKRLNQAAWCGDFGTGLAAEREAVCELFLTGDGMQRIQDFVARSARKEKKA